MKSMDKHIDLHEIDRNIQVIKKAAEELKSLSDNFPALAKNTDRILADYNSHSRCWK